MSTIDYRVKDVDYNVIGEDDEDLFEILGAEGGADGLSVPFAIDALSELAKRGVETYSSKQAAERAESSAKEQLRRSIAADAAWAAALRDLDVATLTRDAGKVAAAKAMADLTGADARSAAAGMSQDKINQRVAAAAAAAKQAAADAANSPADVTAQATLRAWQKVAQAAAIPVPGAQAAATGGGALSSGHQAGPSFWTRTHAGVPMWGWIAGGGVVLLGLTLLVSRRR